MVKDNGQVLYVVLVCFLALAAILILSISKTGNLQAAVTFDKELMDGYQNGCIDSDTKNDFYVKGIVKNKKYQYYDKCLYGQKVVQVYCKSSIVASMTRSYYCRNGCFDGACLR